MHVVRPARRPGQRRAGRAGQQRDLVLLLHQVGDRQRGGGVVDVGDDVHALPVEPVARHRHRDVGLRLVVGRQHLDLGARMRGHEVLGGQLRADHRAGPGGRGVRPVQVGQHADADGLARPVAPALGGSAAGRRRSAAASTVRRRIIRYGFPKDLSAGRRLQGGVRQVHPLAALFAAWRGADRPFAARRRQQRPHRCSGAIAARRGRADATDGRLRWSSGGEGPFRPAADRRSSPRSSRRRCAPDGPRAAR